MIEAKITADCCECDVIIDDADIYGFIYCKKCNDLKTVTEVMEAIDCSKGHYAVPSEHIIFPSDMTKESIDMYFKGVLEGYSSALFWLCDYFDIIPFFEKNVGHNMDKTWTTHNSNG